MPYFKDARLYSESIYSRSEAFFRNVMKAIAKKEKTNAQYLTCLTQKEFENYLKTQALPSQSILKKRYESSALFFEKDKPILLLGGQVTALEHLMTKAELKNKKEIKGIVGYPGKVRGIARVIPDPFNIRLFNKGDILITGMTRPEFRPLIKKSTAIITESGGILSHAAIIARELKKPCIVGTQIATKFFKDGDSIEVDADKGTIKKIK